jgi:hypothetical protein
MSPLRWLASGLLIASIIASLVIALWPASAADTAREDGARLGQAVGELYNAQNQDQVAAAESDISTALSDVRTHAGDTLASQASDTQDALSRAADGFLGTHTTTDSFEADVYQAELNTALDDLSSQADNLRTHGPETHQAFWDGVHDGLPTT